MNYKKKTNIGSGLLVFLIIINCISLINYKLYLIYNQFAFYGNLLALIFIIILRNRIDKRDLKKYIFIFLFLAYGFFTLILTGGGFGSVVTPVFSFILLYVFYNSNFTDKKLKILFVIFFLLNIFWVFNSVGYYTKILGNKDEFLNSNTVGMALVFTSIYITIFSKKLNLKFSKMLSLIVVAASIWAVINVEARGALMVLTVFIILKIFFPWRFWRSRIFTLSVFSAVIFIGTLIPVIYTKMYIDGINYTIPFTTKSLYTGRELIWINYFKMADKPADWIFGLGSNVELWRGKDLNIHNNYLAIINNFGIIGFLLYYGFILKQVDNIYKKAKINKYQSSLIIGFLCVLIYGFTEISTIWYVMFFFNFMFLGLAHNASNIENSHS